MRIITKQIDMWIDFASKKKSFWIYIWMIFITPSCDDVIGMIVMGKNPQITKNFSG
jgi:hypothetical protein